MSSFLVEIASLHALLSIKWKMVTWLPLVCIPNRFGTNNISHVQRLCRQYINHGVLKYLLIIT